MGYKKVNLKNVAGAVNRYGDLPILIDRIMADICTLAVDTIVKAYSDTSGTGSSADSVKYQKISDTLWEVSASSEGLLFLEFGAGITRNQDGATESREALGYLDIEGADEGIVPIGTYNTGIGSLNSWYAPPIRKKTKGTRARGGFMLAINEVHAKADKIIQDNIDIFFSQGGI